MPVNWKFAQNIRLGGITPGFISETDAIRQTQTARSILDSLSHQPGIVLADEVGMGKTYVAMAVIASVLIATKGRPPVIVMTPPGLVSKWKAEWQQFKSKCVASPQLLTPFKDTFAGNPTEFFRAMGDRATRSHLIWMSTSCFSRGLQDPWVKLALCRIARSQTRMSTEARNRFYKWADGLVRMQSRRKVTPELIRRLMDIPLDCWHDRLVAEDVIEKDDPGLVPLHLIRNADHLDCSSLVTVLNGGTIPGRQGGVSNDRLKEARVEFNKACQDAYSDWIRKADWGASLLVLDEAHHAKNDETALAKMLRGGDLQEVEHLILGGKEANQPIFWDKFDRMLFMTATPFQLGHAELIRVLRSFAAARWTGSAAPDHDRQHFDVALNNLEKRLNENQKCGRLLDDHWSKISHQRIRPHAPAGTDLANASAAWWKSVEAGEGDPFDREIFETVQRFLATKAIAQDDADSPWSSLRAWVIRHNRAKTVRTLGGQERPRRVGRHGQAICDSGESEAVGGAGLDLGAEDPLPFLLAARAQGELAAGLGRGRAFFAEGLASSYEAFHHTRDERGADVREAADHAETEILKDKDSFQSIVPVEWYERQIEAFVPDRLRVDEASRHPKLNAVVHRAVDLWRRGEKVLIFCTYRQTARALREHIRNAIENAILRLVAEKADLKPTHDREARQVLKRGALRLSKLDGSLHGEVVRFLNSVFEQDEFQDLNEHRSALVKLLIGYIRSHSFLARYLPSVAFSGESENAAPAFFDAISGTKDASDNTLRDRVQEFLRFAQELAARGREAVSLEDEEKLDPLGDYLKAVAASIGAKEDERDEAAEIGQRASFRALQVVRMVNGATPQDIRERVMLAFNSPLFPEILISSKVLGEGVDLHRFCRFIIHHDLSWNPSDIEQRTGRLDRIRCRAETTGRSIIVYEPYIAESADEKLYRVLRDRERWFQVVMGQKFRFDERTAEKIAERVPLPQRLAESLVFDLTRPTADLRPGVVPPAPGAA